MQLMLGIVSVCRNSVGLNCSVVVSVCVTLVL